MNKIDSQLEYLLHQWRGKKVEERVVRAPEDRIRLSVTFKGDLEPIKRAGFTVAYVVGDIAMGNADLADIERIAALDEVVSLETDTPMQLHLDVSIPEIHVDSVWEPPLSLDGTGVIVGIVDTGIDIFHKSFRKPDGKTRILSIWDQTLDKPQNGEQAPPPPFTSGAVLDENLINTALETKQSLRHVDTIGHGTHVAGIAAGNGSQPDRCQKAGTYVGVARNADIVVVKISIKNPTKDKYYDGVKYIFDFAQARATTLGKPYIPTVMNLSLGSSKGAHDGTYRDERLLNGYVGGPGQVIVVSSGNTGDKNLHISRNINAGGSTSFQFTVKPNDQGDWFDLWYSGAARLTFTLKPQSGPAYPSVPAGTAGKTLAGGPDTVWIESTLNNPQNGKHRIHFSIMPTASGTTITTGPWEITLQETANAAAAFDAWIDWKDKEYDPISSNIDSTARFSEKDSSTAYTVSMPGSSANLITVGAYDLTDSGKTDPKLGNLARFSSRGPTVSVPALSLPERIKPDICAPGVGIMSAGSADRSHWFICDCCIDFYVQKNGTSMAAPFITGVVALMLQRNPSLTYTQALQYLTDKKNARQVPGQTLPNNDWGAGKVDAKATCESVPTLTEHAVVSSGSVGSNIAHFRLSPPGSEPAVLYERIPPRLRTLEQRFNQYPLWQLFAGLVSTHFDEISRLINTNKRVGATWKRLHGPALVHEALSHIEELDISLLPLTLADRPMSTYIERWLNTLARYSSTRLQADIERYRTLILALPGASLRDLEAMEVC